MERTERGGEVTYHGPGQLVAYPIVRLHDRGLLVRPFVRALEAALIATCAAHGVAAGRREGHPGCWCDGDGAAPREDRCPRAAGGARRQLPRHRPQRDRRPRGLRAHRPVRDAGGRIDVDRPRARRPPGATDDGVGRASRSHLRPGVRHGHRRAARPRGLSRGGERPVRASQGPDHGLVGRHDRGPRLPPRPVRAGRRARRRSHVRVRELLEPGGRRGSDPDAQGLRLPRRRHRRRRARARSRPRARAGLAGPGPRNGELAHGHRPTRGAPPAARRRHRAHRGAGHGRARRAGRVARDRARPST